MKKLLLLFISLAGFNCFAQFTQDDFKALHGLSGAWKMQKKKGFIAEKWRIVNDSTLGGFGYMKTASDSIPQENVELSFRSGVITYTPTTANQNEEKSVAFTLTAIDKGKFIFENKVHDFPTMITYQLVDSNTLHAAISGMMNDERREVLYNFTRAQ